MYVNILWRVGLPHVPLFKTVDKYLERSTVVKMASAFFLAEYADEVTSHNHIGQGSSQQIGEFTIEDLFSTFWLLRTGHKC